MREPISFNDSLSQNPDPCIAGCDMEPIAGDIAAPPATDGPGIAEAKAAQR